MNLEITKEKIDKYLPIVRLCATDGIYSLLYVKATDKLVLGAGSADSAQLFVSMDANIIEEGECLIDAKLLNSIWSSIPDGDITMETSGGSMYIKQGKNKWSVSIGDAEDYPIISQEADMVGEISLTDLASAVDMVSFAVSGEDGRPALNAINLSKGTFTATDSVKMAQATTPMTELNITFSSAIQDITKIMTRITSSDTFSIGKGRTWINLKSKNINAWLATVGLNYPDAAVDMIRNMQAEKPEATVVVDTSELRAPVQAAVALGDKSRRGSSLILSVDNGLTLEFEGDAGSITRKLPLSTSGKGKVWLSPERFEEVLRASPTKNLELYIYSDKRPLIGLADNLPWGCALAVLEPEETNESDF